MCEQVERVCWQSIIVCECDRVGVSIYQWDVTRVQKESVLAEYYRM